MHQTRGVQSQRWGGEREREAQGGRRTFRTSLCITSTWMQVLRSCTMYTNSSSHSGSCAPHTSVTCTSPGWSRGPSSGASSSSCERALQQRTSVFVRVLIRRTGRLTGLQPRREHVSGASQAQEGCEIALFQPHRDIALADAKLLDSSVTFEGKRRPDRPQSALFADEVWEACRCGCWMGRAASKHPMVTSCSERVRFNFFAYLGSDFGASCLGRGSFPA
eukprot:2827109-Rhodomonas_salina.1